MNLVEYKNYLKLVITKLVNNFLKETTLFLMAKDAKFVLFEKKLVPKLNRPINQRLLN